MPSQMRSKMWCFSIDFIAPRDVANVLSFSVRMTFTFGTIWACASNSFQAWLHNTIFIHIHCGRGGLSLWNSGYRCQNLICNWRCNRCRLWCWWCQCIRCYIAYYPFFLRFLFDMLHRLRRQCYRLWYSRLWLWRLLMLLNRLLCLLFENWIFLINCF